MVRHSVQGWNEVSTRMQRRGRALIECAVRFHGTLQHRSSRRFGQFANCMHCFERNTINGYLTRIGLTHYTACWWADDCRTWCAKALWVVRWFWSNQDYAG